ncbi:MULTISPECIES: hypothetical protein [unclassified Streptomyces]|uniref:hypothetical protein n=1 Tax=unclassified Streptomyces TaxID=2593676 RepID=UPI0033B377C1
MTDPTGRNDSTPSHPRLKNPPPAFTARPPHAQARAAQHGNTTSADYRTEHDDFFRGRRPNNAEPPTTT